MTGRSRDVRRFYDGGIYAHGAQPEVPPDPGADPKIVLERHSEDGVESFAMRRRIAYLDRGSGRSWCRPDRASVPT